MRFLPALLTFMLAVRPVSATDDVLTNHAAELFRQARNGVFYSAAMELKPAILSTSDGESFIVVWKGVAEPKRWIVSLSGSQGYATDDLAIWHRHIKDRDVGLISLQWWLGQGEKNANYYSPAQLYREIDLALTKLGVKTNSVMLHGFSRGSANSYAVAAMDAGRGKHYFSLIVASSGGVGLDFPPTRAITGGEYGKRPLQNSCWVTSAGVGDPNPERDGVAGMRRAGAWLKEQGARLMMAIEDETEGHGALMRNPANARRVLDLFLKESPKN